MAYSARIFEHMPLYARLADDQGILEHVCDAIQPEFDIVRNRLAQREFIFDPGHPASDVWLDFLGQWLGLAVADGHWLGIGLNPDWTPTQKRRLFDRIWHYWQMKGTNWAIREAIALWLEWEAAHSDRLLIRKPFGNVPTDAPPQWWHEYTPYDAFLNQTWFERQHFGSGDYQQMAPLSNTLQEQYSNEFYTEWSDRVLRQVESPKLLTQGSGLGPERPWMHFFLDEMEWNQIFPNIFELNGEVWATNAKPVVWGWLSYRLQQPFVLVPNEPSYQIEEIWEVDGFQYYDLWHYDAGVTYTYEEEVTTPIAFEIAPGHGHGDVWSTLDFPCPDNYLYYVPYSEFLLTEVITQSEVIPCSPGFEAEVITGYADELVGAIEPTPPSQILNILPAFNFSVDLEIASINLEGDASVRSPAFSDELPSLSLTGIAPIDLSGLAPLAVADLRDPLVVSLAAMSAVSPPNIALVGETAYEWLLPLNIFVYNDEWNNGYEYLDHGSPGDPGHVESVPIEEQVQICNLPDRYSLRQILKREELRTLLDENISILELYPILGQVSLGNNWQLLLETSEEIYILRPYTMFWSSEIGAGEPSDRSQMPDLEAGVLNLYLEFVFELKQDTHLRSYSLLLSSQTIQGRSFVVPLAAPVRSCFGIRFVVPLRLEDDNQPLPDWWALPEYNSGAFANAS